jgi:Tfp pilus assembly protein PilP
MIEYDGTTPLKNALEQLHGKKLSFDAMAKITNKYRARLNLPAGKPVKAPTDKLKIYPWECEAIAQVELPAMPVNTEPLPNELNITQSTKDNELNITQSWDKFISINYRNADNTRHTVQIEQFYIDALQAIGITDIAEFAAVCIQSSTDKVTKRVKRAIVNELVKRAGTGNGI